MKITVRPDLCIAAGQCALTAPAVFDQDDDGIVILLDESPPEAEHERARRAAALCPARVITISETA